MLNYLCRDLLMDRLLLLFTLFNQLAVLLFILPDFLEVIGLEFRNLPVMQILLLL